VVRLELFFYRSGGMEAPPRDQVGGQHPPPLAAITAAHIVGRPNPVRPGSKFR